MTFAIILVLGSYLMISETSLYELCNESTEYDKLKLNIKYYQCKTLNKYSKVVVLDLDKLHNPK